MWIEDDVILTVVSLVFSQILIRCRGQSFQLLAISHILGEVCCKDCSVHEEFFELIRYSILLRDVAVGVVDLIKVTLVVAIPGSCLSRSSETTTHVAHISTRLIKSRVPSLLFFGDILISL